MKGLKRSRGFIDSFKIIAPVCRWKGLSIKDYTWVPMNVQMDVYMLRE